MNMDYLLTFKAFRKTQFVSLQFEQEFWERLTVLNILGSAGSSRTEENADRTCSKRVVGITVDVGCCLYPGIENGLYCVDS